MGRREEPVGRGRRELLVLEEDTSGSLSKGSSWDGYCILTRATKSIRFDGSTAERETGEETETAWSRLFEGR